MANISNRLKKVAEQIDKNASVFDVGADHGLLEKYLLDNDITKNIIAVENKIGPYSTLKSNLKDYKLTILLSDGISSLNKETDFLVLAGMGGILIKNILEKDKEKLLLINNIVVDAHRDVYLIRKFLTNNGFYIFNEELITERELFYFIITFKKGFKQYSDEEYKYGIYKNSEIYKQYLKCELDKLIKIKEKINITDKNNIDRIKIIDEEIERLKNYENNKTLKESC